jgi:hypothetical protein
MKKGERVLPLFGTAPEAWLSQPGADKHFPSQASLRWFFRQNAQRLVEAGALLRIRGCWHAVEPVFTKTLLEIYRSEAHRTVREPEAAERQAAA